MLLSVFCAVIGRVSCAMQPRCASCMGGVQVHAGLGKGWDGKGNLTSSAQTNSAGASEHEKHNLMSD